jgi:WD40 repeat protein
MNADRPRAKTRFAIRRARMSRLVWIAFLVVAPLAAQDQAKAPENVSDAVTVVNPLRLNSLAHSPTDPQIAVAKADKISTYNVLSGEKVMEFKGHYYDVNDVVYSSDGTQILSGSSDKTARLWDVKTGAEIRVFREHTDRVNCVAFSAEGTKIASCSRDKSTIVWDLATGVPIRRFSGHDHGVNAVEFSPNGALVATGGDDGTIHLWDANSGSVVLTFRKQNKPIVDLHFSSTGDRVISASDDGTAVAWDVFSGTEILTVIHPPKVVAAKTVPGRDSFLTASTEQGAKLWDFPTGVLAQSYIDPASIEPITDMDLSPDGTRLVLSSDVSHVTVWDLETGTRALTIDVK